MCFGGVKKGVGWLLLCGVLVLVPSLTHAADVSVLYAQGRLLLKQKRYLDALRTFQRAASLNNIGKRHFRVHFYMAVTHYKLGSLAQAMKVVARANQLARSKQERESLAQIASRIRALFGRVRIRSRVAAGVVGRLVLQLTTRTTFHHADKLRVLKLTKKRWAKQGPRPDGQLFYLPKGTYQLILQKPQCRRFRLQSGGKPLRQFEVGDGVLSLQVIDQPGCPCPGGSSWSTKVQRCLPLALTRKPVGRGERKAGGAPKVAKSSSYVGWIVLITGTLVAGGAVAVYFLAIAPQTQPSPARVRGSFW